MKKLLTTAVLLIINLTGVYSQITGSAIVCAGYVYTYSVNIPGAYTYMWTLPAGWYDISGQSSAQVTATCNVADGTIMVEGWNQNGTSLGVQMFTTQFSAGSGWDVFPNNQMGCVGTPVFGTYIAPNGTGGGAGCPNGCGSGILHNNIDFIIYDNPWPVGNFVSMLQWAFPMPPVPSTYFVYKVDYTNGYIPGLQAILIEGGCGSATVNNTIQLFPFIPLPVTITQFPNPACVGDTISLTANYMSTFLWNVVYGATLLNNGVSPVSLVIDSANALIDITGVDQNGCPNYSTASINVSPCIGTCIQGWYPLSGNYLDSSGNNLHAIWHGVTLAPDRFGALNSAYHFNGSSQWLELPSDFDFPKRTWSLWFYADTITSGYHEIFDIDHANLQNAQTELFLHEQNGIDSIYMSVGDASTGFKTALNEKQWYHVAVVRDSTVIRYYLNGCRQDSVIIPANYNNHSQNGMPTVGLGCDRTHTTYFFKGSMDDVRVYQCALTDSEINILADTLCNPLYIKWEEENYDAIFIYPNPANDFVSVKSNSKLPALLQIFNSLGAIVFENKNFTGEIIIPVKNLSKGIYSIKAGGFVKKLLKE